MFKPSIKVLIDCTRIGVRQLPNQFLKLLRKRNDCFIPLSLNKYNKMFFVCFSNSDHY